MIERVSIVPVVVKDLDEAFILHEKLGFEKVTDVKGPIHVPERIQRYCYSFLMYLRGDGSCFKESNWQQLLNI